MLARGYNEAIRTIRRRKKLTQKTCAARSGIDQRDWSKYETGAKRITQHALDRMRDALECTDTDLWLLANPVQVAHHSRQAQEIREDSFAYGVTPAPAAAAQRLMAMDEKALPAEEQHWFKVQRNALATTLTNLYTALTNVLTAIDQVAARYWELVGKLPAADDDIEENNTADTD